MRGKTEIIEIIISEIDLYVINKVRQLRADKEWSQVALSIELGLSEGAVGKIESLRERAKYSLRHIGILAKVFECSPKEFFPLVPPEGDMTKYKMRLARRLKGDKGKPNYEIIKKSPLKNY
ncbi:MAG: helix-turn-helix transcriptional regulator [Flavitalea sp.]